MNILKFQTNQELNEAAAGIIVGLVQTNPRAVLGLATGSTPVGIYEELVRAYQKKLVSFRHVTTFNLDEYVGIPEDHPQSYRYYMAEHLYELIDIPADHAHIPDGNAIDLIAECSRYNELLEEAQQIDLQILGLGHNGHIGFNEPDHTLICETHVVALREETRTANARFFSALDQVPSRAITMGVGTILKAKMILLVVRGAEKADTVYRALTDPITTSCPASLLQTHPQLVVLLDAEAGRLFA
jgi:glucosamine-6-phosphate deaminase